MGLNEIEFYFFPRGRLGLSPLLSDCFVTSQMLPCPRVHHTQVSARGGHGFFFQRLSPNFPITSHHSLSLHIIIRLYPAAGEGGKHFVHAAVSIRRGKRVCGTAGACSGRRTTLSLWPWHLLLAHIFLNFLFWKNLSLTRNCKKIVENFHIPFPQLPPMITSFLKILFIYF